MPPWEALADPVRRAVVERLAAGELGAGELAAAFPISRPAVSRHLRVLREAGLVTSTVSGQERIYALDRGPLAELDAWLATFRPLPGEDRVARAPAGPAGRLDALDTEMARGRRERRGPARTAPDDDGETREHSTA